MSGRVAALAVAIAVLVAGAGAAPGRAEPPEPTVQHTRCARPGGSPVPTGTPPGHRLLDVAGAHRFSRGAGVRIAIVDTGVAPHPRLPRLRAGGDYVAGGDGLADCDLHGTLIAGLVAARGDAGDGFVGVAPDAEVVSIRQSSGAFRATSPTAGRSGGPSVGAGYGPLSSLAAAIRAAVEQGAQVIVVPDPACAAVGDGLPDDPVGAAVAHARARDAVVVAGAGNLADGTACRTQNPESAGSSAAALTGVRTLATPARFAPLVLAVGAVDPVDGSPAPFSLRGPWVSVAAPGAGVVSLAPGPRGPRLVDALEGAHGPVPLAGSGYAAAYAAGVVALVRSRYPALDAGRVIDRIVATAHGGGRGDQAIGAGVVDPVAALTAVTPGRPSPTAVPARRIAAPSPSPPPDPGTGRVVAGIVAAVVVAAALRVGARRTRP